MKTTEFINTYAEGSVDPQEYNDEAGMSKNSLHTIVRVATHLEQELGDNENLPEWVQEKIAQIKGMMVSVMDYMVSQHEMGKQEEVPGFDADSAEQQFAESLINEEATAGAMGSPSVAVVNSVLGEKGSFSRQEVNKKLSGYGNMLTRGGPVKIKATR
jgi:hypothetical protein